MKIGSIRTLVGPNIYSHDPVLVMRLNLEDLYLKESYEIPGFIDRLMRCLPGIQEHVCGLGRRGGFVERLHSGTYFGHIVEHVALELTDAAGISVNRGKTVADAEPGWYLVAVTYKSERGMKHLLHTAVELVQALINDEPYDLDVKIAETRQIVADYELGPSTQAIVNAAKRRGIPYVRIDENSLVRLGYGKHQRYVAATLTDSTRVLGVDIAGNKELTKKMLAAAALPVPRGCVVQTAADAVACLDRIGPPIVVKPLDGNQGKGVSLNLSTPEQVREAFDTAREFSSQVLVEEMYWGRDYRVVIVGGKLVAAAERVPPHVWGDGTHTISQLIDLANNDPLRGENHEKPLTKIKTDPIVLAILKKNNRRLEDVPAPGELVALRESANLSTGGSAKDVTDLVHPQIRRICERAAATVGLDVCGIDLVLESISQPPSQQGGIVEVNAAPGIRMHHYPTEGEPRDVGGAIINHLFPVGVNGRIPILAITGTNGKTTVARLAAHVLGSTGQRVGLTTTDGIWIGGEEIARGDMTGPWSAEVVLSDRTVETAVLETARGGIVRGGLAYDWSDVGVITNVQADHIGQDGIEGIDDILRIKSLIAERVREGGTLVLNADDERCRQIPERSKVKRVQKEIVWFSLHSDSPWIQQHLRAGGKAYVVHGDWIEERAGGNQLRLMRTASVPLTWNGAAEFQVANLLATVAACRALGVSPKHVATAAASFQANQGNHGRMNLFELPSGSYMLVDYGHNPAAIEAMCRLRASWGDRRTTAVFSLPGDRADNLLAESARLVARGFDHIILKEDYDLRGRQPGELPALIERVIREERRHVPCEIVPDELAAVRAALRQLQPGDVTVVFCDRVDPVMDLLRAEGARPATIIPRFNPTSSVNPAALASR